MWDTMMGSQNWLLVQQLLLTAVFILLDSPEIVQCHEGSGTDSGPGSGTPIIEVPGSGDLILEGFLPYGSTFKDSSVSTDDDGYSDEITLGIDVVIFGFSYNRLYVNTNGVLSFGRPHIMPSTYGSNFNSVSSPPIIAPFWDDIDITKGGTIYYRQESNPLFREQIQQAIASDYPEVAATFQSSLIFVATWDRVEPHDPNIRSLVNTFQVVVVSDGTWTFVRFSYGDIQWGGSNTLIGVSAGDGVNFITHSASLSSSVLLLDYTTTVYRIDGGTTLPTATTTPPPPECFIEGEVLPYNRLVENSDFQLSIFEETFEICIGGLYGSVCDIGWNLAATETLCNHHFGSSFIAQPLYGQGYPPRRYVAQHFNCSNSTSELGSCNYSTIIDPQCYTGPHVAGVRCIQLQSTSLIYKSLQAKSDNIIMEKRESLSILLNYSDMCIDGEVRVVNRSTILIEGQRVYSGVVQVCVNGKYGYVCANDWGNKEADVVCRSNYYSPPPFFENTASATPVTPGNTIPIYHDPICNGTENFFRECQQPRSDSSSTCSSVGTVNCTQVILPCHFERDIILNNHTVTNISTTGSVRVEGKIEVCANFVFHTLCDYYWNPVDAQVFCRYLSKFYAPPSADITSQPIAGSQYGYSRAGNAPYDVKCNGSESDLDNCRLSIASNFSSFCNDPTSSAAGVVCIYTDPTAIPATTPPPIECFVEGEVLPHFNESSDGRLLVFQGTLEICIGGLYGSVCDIGWDQAAAQTLCYNQFGSKYTAEPVYGLGYPPKRYVAQGFNCSSSTTELGSCNYNSVIDAQCSVGPHVAGVKCTEMYSDPPLGIQGLCSVVVWYRPEVPCRDIHGYEVRLYHPQSEHLNLTNRVGVNATHYIVDEDKLVSRDETVVQVRVVYSSGAGKWSEGTSLGCEKPTMPETPPRIYFELNGKIYLNNTAVSMSEIGEGNKALHCKTDKEECCGTVPNRFGEFYYPNGVQIPIARQQHGLYRDRGEQIVRLNRREGIISPMGTYRCEIPNADGKIVKIYITLTAN